MSYLRSLLYMLILAIATLGVGSSGQPLAQDASPQPTLQPGAPVTLMVPTELMPIGRAGLLDLRQLPVHIVNVSESDGAVAVDGRTGWRTEGFPSLWALAFSKISRSDDTTEVELKGDDLVVRLRFGRVLSSTGIGRWSRGKCLAGERLSSSAPATE